MKGRFYGQKNESRDSWNEIDKRFKDLAELHTTLILSETGRTTWMRQMTQPLSTFSWQCHPERQSVPTWKGRIWLCWCWSFKNIHCVSTVKYPVLKSNFNVIKHQHHLSLNVKDRSNDQEELGIYFTYWHRFDNKNQGWNLGSEFVRVTLVHSPYWQKLIYHFLSCISL